MGHICSCLLCQGNQSQFPYICYISYINGNEVVARLHRHLLSAYSFHLWCRHLINCMEDYSKWLCSTLCCWCSFIYFNQMCMLSSPELLFFLGLAHLHVYTYQMKNKPVSNYIKGWLLTAQYCNILQKALVNSLKIHVVVHVMDLLWIISFITWRAMK